MLQPHHLCRNKLVPQGLRSSYVKAHGPVILSVVNVSFVEGILDVILKMLRQGPYLLVYNLIK